MAAHNKGNIKPNLFKKIFTCQHGGYRGLFRGGSHWQVGAVCRDLPRKCPSRITQHTSAWQVFVRTGPFSQMTRITQHTKEHPAGRSFVCFGEGRLPVMAGNDEKIEPAMTREASRQ